MNGDQLSTLWAFCRGDLGGSEFEKWSFEQPDLAKALGEELHWSLISGNYSDRHEVWRLRKALTAALTPLKSCECPAIRDVAHVPIGSDGYDEVAFKHLEQIVQYGPEKWWLYISKCKRCFTIWLIAQEERIYDEYFLIRADEATLANAQEGKWPRQFATYEDVLLLGQKLSNPCHFLDPMAMSLQWTVEELVKARPTISEEQVGILVGISPEHASRLIRKIKPSRRIWSFFQRRSETKAKR